MIAAEMGQTQSWVSRRLLFGRFLEFTTTCGNFSFGEKQLTEGRFRTHWERAGKGHAKETEADRFARNSTLVQRLIGVQDLGPDQCTRQQNRP
jgi:hypothetical protein